MPACSTCPRSFRSSPSRQRAALRPGSPRTSAPACSPRRTKPSFVPAAPGVWRFPTGYTGGADGSGRPTAVPLGGTSARALRPVREYSGRSRLTAPTTLVDTDASSSPVAPESHSSRRRPYVAQAGRAFRIAVASPGRYGEVAVAAWPRCSRVPRVPGRRPNLPRADQQRGDRTRAMGDGREDSATAGPRRAAPPPRRSRRPGCRPGSARGCRAGRRAGSAGPRCGNRPAGRRAALRRVGDRAARRAARTRRACPGRVPPHRSPQTVPRR